MRALRQRSPTQKMIPHTCSQPFRRHGSANGDTPSPRSLTSQGLRTKVPLHLVKRVQVCHTLVLYLYNLEMCPTGKLFSLGHNPSMGSVDSDIGHDMGSMHSDLGLLEDAPSLSDMVPANSSPPSIAPTPFLRAQPANPAMAALTSQHRDTHNRSPISFREGRRASDTSLTQGQNHQRWLVLCFLGIQSLFTSDHAY